MTSPERSRAGKATWEATGIRRTRIGITNRAPDHQAVCDRAYAAWTRFHAEIRDTVQPRNAPEYDQMDGIGNVRSAFYAITHERQDFYAHGSWVELHVASGQSPPLALALFPNRATFVTPDASIDCRQILLGSVDFVRAGKVA